MYKPTTARIVAALVFFSVTGAEAGPPWFATTGKLTRIGTGLTGEGLYLTLDMPTKSICLLQDRLFMETTNRQYRETISIALLAFAQARPIDVYYDGTCLGDNVKLFAVSVRTSP